MMRDFQKDAILRDFLKKWMFTAPKRRNSSRLLKLTTWKTKQFCETSFKTGKLSAELAAWYQSLLRCFHSIAAPARKKWGQVTRSAAPVMRNHLSKPGGSDAPCSKWGWVNAYRYIFSGMNIHLPAILGFTRYQGFDPSPNCNPSQVSSVLIS